MLFRSINDNDPYTATDGTKYPWNFPKSAIAELSPITLVASPTYDPLTQSLAEIAPVQIAGVWTQQWLVSNLPTAVAAANQAAKALADADAAALGYTKADPVAQYIITHTPAEIAAYVGTQVTSLATAVPILQKMAFILGVLAKDKLR